MLSQCNTSVILKITNPNDLRAIISSIEGAYQGMDELIKSLPQGRAIISGALEVPIVVDIRPRKTMHGGRTTLGFHKVYESILNQKDESLMELKRVIIPCIEVIIERNNKEYKLLASLYDGGIITNLDIYESRKIPPLQELSSREINALRAIKRKTGLKSYEKEINKLIELGLVNKELELSNEYIFDNPFKYTVKRNPVYKSIGSHLEKKINEKLILDQLSYIGKIKSFTPCYLLTLVP